MKKENNSSVYMLLKKMILIICTHCLAAALGFMLGVIFSDAMKG